MAPVYKVTQTGKDKTNLRKPVVEKMRRDRINKCIEQLKVLLKAEIKAKQPCCKLEKADVLEMAVIYLQCHSRPLVSPNSSTPAAQCNEEGFSRCPIEETARFLLFNKLPKTTKRALIKNFNKTQQPKGGTKYDCVSAPKGICQISSKCSGDQMLWRLW